MSLKAGLVVLVLSARAWAGAEDDAAAMLRDADRSLHACDIARALLKYRAVWDRTQHADVLLRIADALRLIGRLVQAAHTYERYLDHPGADPAKRPDVEKKLADIDRQIGRLRVQPGGPGQVSVDGSPAGEAAEVQARVDPGAHAATLERDGVIRAAEAVTVKPGEVRVVTFGKVAAPPPPVPPPPARSAAGGLAATADALAKACKLLEAVQKYREAQQVAPKGRVARHLGETLERADRPAEAADAYDDSLRLGKDPGGKAQAEKRLTDLDGRVGKARFGPTAPGAKLLLDGRPAAVRPEGFARVDPGSHAALLEVDGAVTAAATFTAEPGAETSVTLDPLEAGAASAASVAAVPPVPAAAPVAEVPAARSAEAAAEAPAASPEEAFAKPAAPETAAEATARATPIRVEEPAGHDGQMSAVIEGSADARTGDVGPSAGLAFGVGGSFEFVVLVLDQRLKGVRLAGTWLILPEPALKPYVQAGLPIFSRDGGRAGVRGAAGLVWDFTDMTGVNADVALEHFPDMPAPYYKTYVLVSAGLQLRSPR